MASLAVHLNEVSFSYGSYNVLNAINLNVRKGCIYALLGPSGCGKTTVLDIIIGLKNVSYGRVEIFGYEPGTDESGVPGPSVGYMPQEIALEFILTIDETFEYFGRIFTIKPTELKERINFLVNLLQLPKGNRLIKNLSGGEQRRVSLAVSVLHKPRLLLLDEPTVGVDPLLRKNIWAELNQLTQIDNMTVIITTHYIEEARLANRIGFLNEGKILIEDAPSSILNKYEVNTLEQAFFKINCKCNATCETQSTKRGNSKSEECTKEPFISNRQISRQFSIISALLMKTIILTKREPFHLVLLAISGQILIWFVWYSVGQPPENIPTALFIEPQRLEGDDYNLVELLLSSIDKKIIKLKNYDNFSNAIDDVKNLNCLAFIYVNENFSSCFRQQYIDNLDSSIDLDEMISNETIINSKIYLYADFTHKILINQLRYSLFKSIDKFLKLSLQKYSIDLRLAQPLISFKPISGQLKEKDFFGLREIILCGYWVSFSFSVPFILSSFGLIREIANKWYKRNVAIGVKYYQVIIAGLLAYFIVFVISIIVSILNCQYLLGLHFKSSMIYTIIALSMLSLFGQISGMFYAVVVKDSNSSLLASNFCMIGIVLISGAFWPISAMSYYIRWITDVLPFAPTLNLVWNSLFKGETSLINEILLTSFWILFFTLILIFSMRKMCF